MAILSNGKFYGFLCSVKETGRKLANGVKEYVEDFASGFTGHGWKLWEYVKGKWKLEIDTIVVRETMIIFEMLISKIRAIIGAQAITQGHGKVKSARISDDGSEYLIILEDEDMSIEAHDFIRCQTFVGDKTKLYHVEVASVDIEAKTLHVPLSEFNQDEFGIVLNPPETGDELVQFGNSQNKARQSAIYMHADESGQPAIDVMFDLDSKSWENKVKVRVGGEIPGTNGLRGFYSVNGLIKGVDDKGVVVYEFSPDGTVNIGRGNIRYNPTTNKVTLGSGVTLTWDNLDDETKENLKGDKGDKGDTGLQGVPGETGKDGKVYYTWIRYADSADGSGISNDPTGKKYMGFAYNKETATESNDPSDYTWSKFRGEDGTDGIQGPSGENGKPTYTWIAYSDYSDGRDMYQIPGDNTKYIGIAVNKETAKESDLPSDYTWSKFKGEDGIDGKYTELRYKYFFGKPVAPTRDNLVGWSLSPDVENINISCSGDFTKDGEYYVSPSPTAPSVAYKERISFVTTKDNQVINIEMDVSSESLDKGIIYASDSDNIFWSKGGSVNEVVVVPVSTAGAHYIDIAYTKDNSVNQLLDRVRFRVLKPTTCWISTAVIYPDGSGTWSDPVLFPTDTDTNEQVYLLSKSEMPIDLPVSDQLSNEYIGEADVYNEGKSYAAGNVVRHEGIYKVALKSSIGILPTNEEYWQEVKWWNDNPYGVSAEYPYEYTCDRDSVDGKWGSYKNYRLFMRYAKDGNTGAPGEDAILPEWLEKWNGYATDLGKDYIVTPKMFSGTKTTNSEGKVLLTGIAQGKDCLTAVDGTTRTGIFALVDNEIVFELDPINKKYKFSGRIETSIDGKRIVIDPESNSLLFYRPDNSIGASVGINNEGLWEFSLDRSDVGTMYPDGCIVNGNQIALNSNDASAVIQPSQFAISARPGEYFWIAMRQDKDTGEKTVVDIRSPNWPTSAKEILPGGIYVENGFLKVNL